MRDIGTQYTGEERKTLPNFTNFTNFTMFTTFKRQIEGCVGTKHDPSQIDPKKAYLYLLLCPNLDPRGATLPFTTLSAYQTLTRILPFFLSIF